MKLSEIKSTIVENFFKNSSNGVDRNHLSPVFEELGRVVSLELNYSASSLVEADESVEGVSSDPSKAFKRFTEGKISLFTILEEDGIHRNAIFAAVRSGKKVAYADLTVTPSTYKLGDLAIIKNAARQAKNLNEDAYFSLTVID